MAETGADHTKLAPSSVEPQARSRKPQRLRGFWMFMVAAAVLVIVAGLSAAWLAGRASAINKELTAATALIAPLRDQVSNNEQDQAAITVEKIRTHTAAAKKTADDPLWTLASALPVLGPNLSAVSEVSRSADDVANLGLAPLVKTFSTLDWESLVPNSIGSDLAPWEAASPSVQSAAHAVHASADRLSRIDASQLWEEVAQPLTSAREQLHDATSALDAAASASEILPGMLGADAPRNYLIMIQNNAEARASGGIPGALAVLSLDKGKLTLGAQSSATDVGIMSPVLAVDAEQQQIYSARLGKFMQDVNLTPDFPTAAALSQAMWERKTGQRVDGVFSIDPVALSYLLDATGPITLDSPELRTLAKNGLPTQLDSKNVVATLLSAVYSEIRQPSLQDIYFAGVAQKIFGALSDGKGDAKGLIEGITRGAVEGRVLAWSGRSAEQSVINRYAISGSIAGPSVSPAQFGVYFNDGTGAKMDYYVKRTVQLFKECTKDGYEQVTVRVISTNTAPPDGATSLPTYVTGDGNFGVPPGSVQTNIVAYGPAQSNVETVIIEGKKTEFAAHLHSNRPVGVVAVRLAPGESRTVEFTFGKIVQHTEPNVVVTPTVQDVNDVTLPTKNAVCAPAS